MAYSLITFELQVWCQEVSSRWLELSEQLGRDSALPGKQEEPSAYSIAAEQSMLLRTVVRSSLTEVRTLCTSLCTQAEHWESDLHLMWVLSNTPTLAEFTPAVDSPLQGQQRDTSVKGCFWSEVEKQHVPSPVPSGQGNQRRCLQKELAMNRGKIFVAPAAVTACRYCWNPSSHCAGVRGCQATVGCFKNFTLPYQCLSCYTTGCSGKALLTLLQKNSSWKLSHCKIFRIFLQDKALKFSL